ncbi:hypothetical protein Rleg9DRAFT_0284 [Rhizobium leguminosarum bv. trifolii WSM597]|uniref:Uncharacterized protein n=1 Tax=Rhizobium leguminosarum bv. trifolii WSM597 TaxID=754764 RepID=I9WYJ5_RHILT|nr:hypothetical protein Rleg9DRAFT_0284 [Rhizobium leguminosarum bv. trifolii WSM597]
MTSMKGFGGMLSVANRAQSKSSRFSVISLQPVVLQRMIFVPFGP